MASYLVFYAVLILCHNKFIQLTCLLFVCNSCRLSFMSVDTSKYNNHSAVNDNISTENWVVLQRTDLRPSEWVSESIWANNNNNNWILFFFFHLIFKQNKNKYTIHRVQRSMRTTQFKGLIEFVPFLWSFYVMNEQWWQWRQFNIQSIYLYWTLSTNIVLKKFLNHWQQLPLLTNEN